MKVYIKLLRDSLPYLLITGIAVFMFRGIFAPGFMSGHDNSFHYYVAYYLTETLIPEFHWISGWSMRCLAGFPILVDYCQIGFLLVAFLNKALFLPLNLSYKVVVLFSYIFLGFGFYKLASCRFGKSASLFACVCLMLQKDIYYDKILSGVWNNYLALGLFFIFFHLLDKNIETITVKKSLMLGLILGVLILAHLFVALFAFMLLAIYAIPYLMSMINKKKSLFKPILFYFCIPISAFMIASYYLCNVVTAKNYFSTLVTKSSFLKLAWVLKSFFGPLENVNSISDFMINIPVIARIIFSFFGIYIFLKKEKALKIRRFLISTIIFVFISLVLFSDILASLFSWWHNIPFMTKLHTTRFLIYVQIGMYLFMAYGIAEFLKHFKKKQLIIAACAVPMLFSAFFHYNYLAQPGSRTLTQSPWMPDVYKVWAWLKNNAPSEEGRVIYQNTNENMNAPILGRSDVFALSGIFTRLSQIGISPFFEGRYLRTDKGDVFEKPIDTADAGFIGEMMDNFNSRYIVSVMPNLKEKLNTSDLFFKEADFGPFSIFRLKNFKNEWIKFKGDATYKKITFKNQHIQFHINNKSADNEAFIKISYHPLWRGRLNNKSVRIERDKYELMKISLPDKGDYELELLFSSFNRLWASVSLLTLMGIGLLQILYLILRPVPTGKSDA
ncbi:MAG: hypothetical protein JSV93_05290 [Candidatus Omnitrophota bacterium]|nr:MAG: hypothetical protein JSV93_05290 [Candidatus Omnitrophota bacterium]